MVTIAVALSFAAIMSGISILTTLFVSASVSAFKQTRLVDDFKAREEMVQLRQQPDVKITITLFTHEEQMFADVREFSNAYDALRFMSTRNAMYDMSVRAESDDKTPVALTVINSTSLA